MTVSMRAPNTENHLPFAHRWTKHPFSSLVQFRHDDVLKTGYCKYHGILISKNSFRILCIMLLI